MIYRFLWTGMLCIFALGGYLLSGCQAYKVKQSTNIQKEKDSSIFTVSYSDLFAISQGACFLASGGGGSLQFAKKTRIPHYFSKNKLMYVASIDSSLLKRGFLVGSIGSPAASRANPAPKNQNSEVFSEMKKRVMQEKKGSIQDVNFCMPVEIGVANILVPLLISQQVSVEGAPVYVVDIDGAGRSVPTIPLVAYDSTLPIVPNVVGGTSSLGVFNTASFNVKSSSVLEEGTIALLKTSGFGVDGSISLYSASSETLIQSKPVLNSISHSLNVGHIIDTNEGLNRRDKVLQYIRTQMNRASNEVFYGQVTHIQEKTGGFDQGFIQIQGIDSYQGQVFKVFIQNENIWAELIQNEHSRDWVISPDSINYLVDEGDVFDNSDLKELFNQGERPLVRVIAVKADERVLQNNQLLQAWQQELKSQGGPEKYASPWLNSNNSKK